MPDLPATVYGPAFVFLGSIVTIGIPWAIKWARTAEKEKDAIQDKWIAFQEKQIPVQIQQNALMVRLLAMFGD